jgi:hypothetical protein
MGQRSSQKSELSRVTWCEGHVIKRIGFGTDRGTGAVGLTAIVSWAIKVVFPSAAQWLD